MHKAKVRALKGPHVYKLDIIYTAQQNSLANSKSLLAVIVIQCVITIKLHIVGLNLAF